PRAARTKRPPVCFKRVIQLIALGKLTQPKSRGKESLWAWNCSRGYPIVVPIQAPQVLEFYRGGVSFDEGDVDAPGNVDAGGDFGRTSRRQVAVPGEGPAAHAKDIGVS